MDNKKINKKSLQTNKTNALEAYKTAKQAYLTERSDKNWITFCEAKALCMRLGIRI